MSESCDENDCLPTRTSAKRFLYCFVFVCLFVCFFSESYIELLLLMTKNLQKEKKEFMGDILTQIVHGYEKFNVHSRDDLVESLTHNIVDAFNILLVTVNHHSGLPSL